MKCPRGTISNVTITVSKNSMNITGIVTSITENETFYVHFNSNGAMEVNKTYTCKMGAECSTHTISALLAHIGNNSYNRIFIDLITGTQVFMPTKASNAIPTYEIYIDNVQVNDTINITLKDLALYEGEFKNPPVISSLDVKPRNHFMLTDLSNNAVLASKFYSGTLATDTRYRIINLGTVRNAIFHGNFILFKSYNNNPSVWYNIQFSAAYNSFANTYTGKIKINGFSGQNTYAATGTSGVLRSAQLAVDSSTGNIYVCVTTGTSTPNNDWAMLFNEPFFRGTAINMPQEMVEAMTISSNTTDTIIVTSDAIDGF
jgi:hypothetical protein